MICERCFQPLEQGEHGVNLCPLESRAQSAVVIGDEIPGGQYFENGFEQPTKFYSHSEHRAALAARGLEIRAKWAGEHDKIMSRWDTVDLDAAKALLERGAQRRREHADRIAQACAEFPITVTTVIAEAKP